MTKSLLRYVSIQAEPPSLNDNTADIDRLKKALAEVCGGSRITVSYAVLPRLAGRFRQAGFIGSALVFDRGEWLEVLDFFRQQPSILATMALDLGTTHLEASLIDAITGKPLARANRPNSQIDFGADILSRIHRAGRGDGLARLHQAIVEDINQLARSLAEQALLAPDEIYGLSVSGNPTMIHLFLGIDPSHICREPYIPMVNAPDPFPAVELNLDLYARAPVLILPGVGSYFGGDLVSGIVATGLDQQETTCMLIDVGTNAEVVLGNRDWLIACAGAAGPALEGGVARMGMRAGPGAIERVSVHPEDGSLVTKTIADEKPCGLCGSGIIDLVAALYLTRMIDIRGKFRKEAVGDRFVETEDGPGFIVVPAEQAANHEAVILSQVDLDALMRSKAAMYAILTTLVNQVGLSFESLGRIYVAGAFGKHIDPRQAITLGMLPDLPITIFEPIGNSSLAGAEAVLTDGTVWRRAHEVVQTITYVELNVNQEFMMRFSGSKFIPHTDRTLFPSVPIYD